MNTFNIEAWHASVHCVVTIGTFSNIRIDGIDACHKWIDILENGGILHDNGLTITVSKANDYTQLFASEPLLGTAASVIVSDVSEAIQVIQSVMTPERIQQREFAQQLNDEWTKRTKATGDTGVKPFKGGLFSKPDWLK